jgi:hypothetical protein
VLSIEVLIPTSGGFSTREKMGKYEYYPLEIRAQIVSLILIGNMKPIVVVNLLNIPHTTVNRIVKHAKQRGYDPTVNPCLDQSYIAEALCSGCLKVIAES